MDELGLVSIIEALKALAAESPQKVPSRAALNLALNRGQIEGGEKNKWGRWVMRLEAVRAWNEGRKGHGGRPRERVEGRVTE